MKLSDVWPKTDLEKEDVVKMPRAFHPEKYLPHVLHQIASDLRENYDQSYYSANWGVDPRDLRQCNIKVHGTKLLFQCFETYGGHRVPYANPSEVLERSKETSKALDEYISNFKKEFKKRTGKNLKLGKPEVKVGWEPVALNGLIRIAASKLTELSEEMFSQKWPENAKEVDKDAME